MSSPASTEAGQYFPFIEGAPSLPPLQMVYAGGLKLSPLQELVVAHISTGFSRIATADLIKRTVSTVKNVQEEASRKLGVDNTNTALTVATQASGLYEDFCQHLVDEKPYDADEISQEFWALTDRQREVLILRASGYTAEDIASRDGRSINTIKNLQRAITEKLHGGDTGDGSINTAIAALWLERHVRRVPVEV